MATGIMMRHATSGLVKKGYTGFSWTTFFFGFLPALFRADFITFIGGFIISIIIGIFTLGIGTLLIGFIWAFFYNKYFTRKLIERGYEFLGSPEQVAIARNAIGVI